MREKLDNPLKCTEKHSIVLTELFTNLEKEKYSNVIKSDSCIAGMAMLMNAYLKKSSLKSGNRPITTSSQ